MLNDNWHARLITLYSLGVGMAGWWLLARVTQWDVVRTNLWPLLAFATLSVVLNHLYVDIAPDVRHSLAGIVDLAAVLTFGPTAGAWVAVLGKLIYVDLRAPRQRLLYRPWLVEHPLFSSGLKALMALACGEVYSRLGGTFPAVAVTWQMFVPLLPMLALWFALDHASWSLSTLLRAGWPAFHSLFRKTLTHAVMIKLLPLPLSIVVAGMYTSMGPPAFVLLAVGLVASAVLLQQLSQTQGQTKKSLVELGVLNEFGRALVEAQLDVEQLYDTIYAYCKRLVDAPVFTLELVDTVRNQVHVVIDVQKGERQATRKLPITETLRRMAASREPFLSNNVQKDGLPFEPDVVGQLPRSLLIVPLLANQELIGMLTLQSDHINAFDQDQLVVLSSMANQAASAIASARAYESEQRRATQLAAVSQVSRRVTKILELDRLFADVVQWIEEEFHYDHVAVYTTDSESEGVVIRASTNPVIQEQGLEVPLGDGIIGWVAQYGKPVLANDVAKESRYHVADQLESTKAELTVPLKVEDRIVGVLDVQGNEVGAFGEDDLFILQTLGDQIAIAVEDARLYAARQEEAWMSTALLQVAEAVGNLDNLDDILETAVRITPMLVGIDRCSILLWYGEQQEFVTAAGYTASQEMRPLFESMRFQPGDSALLDQLLGQQRPIFVHSQSEAELIPPSLVDEFGIQGLLALPLRAQAELQGVMLADYVGQPAQFSDRKRAILSGIADRVGMAIANVRLHIAQREEAWVSTALLQVAQAVVSSADLQENLARIARLTPLLVGVDRCLIFLWQEGKEQYVPGESYGLSKELTETWRSLRLKPADVPLLEEMMREQRYVMVEDMAESSLVPPSLVRTFDIHSLLAAPMTSRGETLGALLVAYTQGPRRFSARNISIVEGIAHQTALAIENARLYEATLEQERVAEELRVARDIQVSFLPQHCPSLPGWEIAADWRAARVVGGDFYDFIPLDAEHLGLVIADVSDKGVPAALFMSLSRTLVRVGAAETKSPAKALQRVNDLILTETHSDMFLTVFYGVLNWRTGHLTYANAGHNPPIVWRCRSRETQAPAKLPVSSEERQGCADASSDSMLAAEPNASILTAAGIVLGVIAPISLEECQTTIEPGDILVLYTDGVTEPINEKGEEFGEGRLLHVIASNCDRPCREIVSSVGAAVSSFAGEQPDFDDYTLISLKRGT